MEGVLIATPTCDIKGYCLGTFLNGLSLLPFDAVVVDNSLGRKFFDGDLAVGVDKIRRMKAGELRVEYVGGLFDSRASSRERLAVTRNRLREHFLSGDYQHFLSLESDVVPSVRQVRRLFDDYIALGRPVMAALIQRAGGDTVVSKRIEYEPGVRLRRRNLPFSQLVDQMVQVQGCPLAMTLVSRSILEEIAFRFEERVMSHDDSFFSLDVIAAGHKIYSNGFVRPVHNWRHWKGFTI